MYRSDGCSGPGGGRVRSPHGRRPARTGRPARTDRRAGRLGDRRDPVVRHHRPGRGVPGPVHGRARHLDRQRGPAGHPAQPPLPGGRPPVGGDRLLADLRRASCCWAAGWPTCSGGAGSSWSGSGVFTAASLLGGFATNQATLIAARSLQGVGAAILSPATLTILTVTFQRPAGPGQGLRGVERGGRRRRRRRGPVRRVSSPSTCPGGGSCSSTCPSAIALFAVARLRLHESRGEGARGRLDVAGAVTVTGALFLLVYAISHTDVVAWTAPSTLLVLVAVARAARSSSSPSRPRRRPIPWSRSGCSGSARSPAPTWSCSASGSACSPCGSSSPSTCSRSSATARWSPASPSSPRRRRSPSVPP